MAGESTYGKMHKLLSEQEKKDYDKWIRSSAGKQSKSLIGSDYSIGKWKEYVSEVAKFGLPSVDKPKKTLPSTIPSWVKAITPTPKAPPPELSDEDKALLKSQGLSDAAIQEQIDASKARTQQEWIALSQAGQGAQWRPGELELMREKFAWDKEQSSLAKIQEQSRLELQFEQDRNQLLRGLPSDDWIRRWTLQNQPNPYKVQPVSQIDQLGQILNTYTATKQEKQSDYEQALIAQSEGEGSGNESALAENVRATKEDLDSAEEFRDRYAKAWQSAKTESRDWTPQVTQPYPNAPGWMPQYAPGLVGGQMITKQAVPTPSGQQLTQMPTSQLQQLGYYGEWAGSPLSSARAISESAALMQPETPFGRTRWSPAGARV